MNNFFATVLTLFLAIDALGIIPSYLYVLKKCDYKKRIFIALRELGFALIIMILFHFLGIYLLELLSLTKTTVQIASGTILFLIAIRLLFPGNDEKEKISLGQNRPFIVPIATPLIAGPSVLAVVMISTQVSDSNLVTLGAIFISWFASSIILIFANPIYRVLGDKALSAAEKLMGLVIALIAIETIMNGISNITLVK